MTKAEEFSPSLEGVLSHRPEVQLGSLRAIKDSIIGQPQQKALYLKQNIVRTLFELLKEPSVSPDAKVEATVILGSLCYGISLSLSLHYFLDSLVMFRFAIRSRCIHLCQSYEPCRHSLGISRSRYPVSPTNHCRFTNS